MRRHVPIEFALAHERFRADIAAERTITGVNTHMQMETVKAGEAFWTEVAREAFDLFAIFWRTFNKKRSTYLFTLGIMHHCKKKLILFNYYDSSTYNGTKNLN